MMTIVSELLPFDGGRHVTAYVPDRAAEAVVFCGDGQLIPHWGSDLAAKGLRPTMIVGAHSNADETLRLHEYSPTFDPTRFDQHESFFVEDVRWWARSTFGIDLPRERTAVFGVSAGGELALAMGVRHTDLFGAVLAASPGAGFRPTDQIVRSIPPTYLVAGKQEPFFLDNALRWTEAIRDKGRDVVMMERDGGHDDAMWRAELPKMIAWVCSHCP